MKKKKYKVKKRTGTEIVINPPLEEDIDVLRSMEKTIVALLEKAQSVGIPFDIVEQVFFRGYTDTQDVQRAFDRVNSYIAKGRTYFEEDADLHADPVRKTTYNSVIF
jgi:hypothetical protein